MSKAYDPVSSDHGKRLMTKARVTNRERDAIDRRSGDAAPQDCTLKSQLRTVISAVAAGIDGKDWSAVAEGLDMLIRAEQQTEE